MTSPSKSPELYRKFYEHEAGQYRITREAEPAWIHRRNLVRRLLPRRIDGTLLDAGCGDGAMSEDLADAAGVAVVGVDVSMARVRYAAEHGRQAKYLQGSIYDLPFATDAVPLVVCTVPPMRASTRRRPPPRTARSPSWSARTCSSISTIRIAP